MKLTRTLILVVGLCATLANAGFAGKKKSPGENRGNGNSAAENVGALSNLTIGTNNTAHGWFSLSSNTEGSRNTADGFQALFSNTTANDNTAVGTDALLNNNGSSNTALGAGALESNTSGEDNTAVGFEAGLTIVDGDNNVCIGFGAGNGIVSANNQVAIGVPAAGPFADISNTCFIRSIYNQPVSSAGTAQDVYVDEHNVLGFLPSSQRFKHDIKPMDKASEALLALKPVTFKYNGDRKGQTQYGLIAEEVAKVAPDLVFRDKDGDVQTVRFEQIGAMLLNEFLKEHKKVEELQATIAQQQKGMEALTAQLKEQAAQIQKVGAQIRLQKSAPRLVENNQ